MARQKLYLGMDAGSESLNTVIIKDGEVVAEDYTRIRQQTAGTALEVLGRLLEDFPASDIAGTGATGSGGKLLAELLNGSFTNEVVAQTKSVERFYPDARTIIDIGGEDAKVIFPRYDSDMDALVVEDFSMNTMCAAGTGSFLDQQAHRLGVSIEDEFGELALKSKNPPRIAGRCSVFAKTDMIHLQQEGTPDYDIIAGLCFALARTFKSNICKGRDPLPPVIFQGGVAANRGMVRAIRETFNLEGEELIIPTHHASMGAIGAALLCGETGEFPGLSRLEDYLKNYRSEKKGLEPLPGVSGAPAAGSGPDGAPEVKPGQSGYLGIDVGSLSTNVVVIDDKNRLIARRYLPTAGRPIEAVRRGIKEIGEEIGDIVRVRGVGTTGSGRYLIGDFVGADTVKNEITAQATASIFIDPGVDTIFEIGGQDSKYISVENGVVVDFEMNKVCAAGTGSFLEEQAERLTLSIREEFGNRALSSGCPVPLGERCTVFMESDIVSHQQEQAKTEDLVAGLAYSIVKNYLNRVVGKRKIGERIFFQGAVALNRGVVAAFEKVLGKKITVPPNNDVTGAIGVAMLARENSSRSQADTNFKGWDRIAGARYEMRSFECRDCPNHCEIREVIAEGSNPFYYGSRCEKYNTDRSGKTGDEKVPDLFREREKFLRADYDKIPPSEKKDGRVGIPLALYTYEMLPFWKSFLENLGFEIVFSDKTNKQIIRDGVDTVASETCFPVKVAHGHIKNILEKKDIDYLFLPMVLNMKKKSPGTDQSSACPYVQALPHMARSSFDFKSHGVKVITTSIALGWGERLATNSLLEMGREFGRSRERTMRAIRAADSAQEKFYAALKKRGQEILASLPPGKTPVVVVSRPYNGCDNGVNLNLPNKLRSLDAFPIPMDYLSFDEVDLSREWPSMYWRYGQKILGAAEIIRRDNRLQCLYITNFGCGPDSFITQFFREKMSGKPYLEIEVDEHSADVGAITRCEAFLDSIRPAGRKTPESSSEKLAFVPSNSHPRRKLYIPYMGDIAHALVATLRAEGLDGEVFPPSNEETLEIGRRFTCGRECYPCIITTGDMLRITRRPDFDPGRSAFFMPTAMGPCRFGQYNRLQRIILNEEGFGNVPIISPNQINNLDSEMRDFGRNLFRKVWKGILAVDILNKMVRETRPYEKNPGETDRAYEKSLKLLVSEMENRRSPYGALEEAVRIFSSIPVSAPGSRPVVGIIGEIFVRSHEFANNNIVREIESLGGEAWLTPASEWFFHVTNSLKLYNRMTGRYGRYLLTLLTGYIQKRDEENLERAVEDFLRQPHEPPISEIWEKSEPYLPGWFGETALGIGKSADYIEKGASGIINVMPFTCLPGNIAGAIFKRFREDFDNIPCLNMAYDGLEETNTRTRLEAFMYQVEQFRERTSAKKKTGEKT